MYRLYAKGRILGHKRGKRNTRPNTSLLQIEGVASKGDTKFYLGKVRIPTCLLKVFLDVHNAWALKRVAYVYKAKTEVRGTNVRVIWGFVYVQYSGKILGSTESLSDSLQAHNKNAW